MADFITLVAWVGLCLVFLWSPSMRTMRSVLFLGLATGAFFLTPTLLPVQAGRWIQAAIAIAVGLALLIFYRSFVSLPAADLRFFEAIEAANKRLQRVARAFEEHLSDTETWRRSLESVIAEISALNPPDIVWEPVRTGAISLLRRRIELLDQGAVTEDDRRNFVEQRQELHQRIASARARRSSFWRL